MTGTERVVDALRLNIADLEEHIFWIRQHTVALRDYVMSPKHRLYTEARLQSRLRSYRSSLRRVVECEESLGYSLSDAA